MSQIRLGARVMLGIPTLSSNPRTPAWIDAMAGLQMPLGSSMGRAWMVDETIAAARNALCEQALASDVEYLVMLGDDVLPPAAMLISMLASIGRELPIDADTSARIDLLTGVYWTKAYPTEPYLWNGPLDGSFTDWKVGELLPVNLAGCDALMIRTEILKEIPRPWFSTDWVYEPGQRPSPIATEDFYFFTKARKHGYRLFVDTAIQCWHQDRDTGQMFGLTVDMPQAGGVPEGGDDVLVVADVGSGTDSPSWGPNCTVTRFDARADVKPDVQCDIRKLPEGYFGQYDVVHARHVLEHFGRAEAPELLRHWLRLLKPGGELILRVPNLASALRHILDDDAPKLYDWAQIYGEQKHPADFHRNGFTARKLRGLLGSISILGDVEVIEEDDGRNLKATARLLRADEPEAIAPWWDEITSAEGFDVGNGIEIPVGVEVTIDADEPVGADARGDWGIAPATVVALSETAVTTADAITRLNGHEAGVLVEASDG